MKKKKEKVEWIIVEINDGSIAICFVNGKLFAATGYQYGMRKRIGILDSVIVKVKDENAGVIDFRESNYENSEEGLLKACNDGKIVFEDLMADVRDIIWSL